MMSGKKINSFAEVISNHTVGKDIHYLTFRSAAIAGSALPGQFVFIKPAGPGNPLLRRAFSIADTASKKKTVSIYFDIKGQGTLALSRMRPGESLQVLGPLGNGFHASLFRPRNILIAGGCGLAPVMFLATVLRQMDTRVFFYYGACSRKQITMTDRLKRLSHELIVVTEDGSLGQKGLVTEVVGGHGDCSMFACGPNPMLKAISKTWKQAYVALETEMACGLGVCMGCAVKMKNGDIKRCCLEGPVFRGSEVAW